MCTYSSGDLPIFDLLFGTLHNARDFADATGFYDGASERAVEMLAGIDVAEPDARLKCV